MSTIEKRIEELGIILPPPPAPRAHYVSMRQTGNLLFFSGAGPFDGDTPVYMGRVGIDLSKEDGYKAARLSALNLVSALKHAIGDLDRVEQFVKLLAFVASAPDFYEQPAVINGASDVLFEIFGERGMHARSAVATHVLPFNMPVEIEMIVECKA